MPIAEAVFAFTSQDMSSQLGDILDHVSFEP